MITTTKHFDVLMDITCVHNMHVCYICNSRFDNRNYVDYTGSRPHLGASRNMHETRIRIVFNKYKPHVVKLYIPAEPGVRFINNHTRLVEWIIGRDLIRKGCKYSAGLGDVHVSAFDDVYSLITLVSPSGTINLFISKIELVEFIQNTYHIMSFADEQKYIRDSVDYFIATIDIDNT